MALPSRSGLAVVDRRDEAVTASGQGLNEARSRCEITQRLANPIHGFVHRAVEIDESVGVPKTGLQLLSGNHLAATLKQDSKELGWLILKFDFDAAFAQLARFEIDLEDAETDSG